MVKLWSVWLVIFSGLVLQGPPGGGKKWECLNDLLELELNWGGEIILKSENKLELQDGVSWSSGRVFLFHV